MRVHIAAGRGSRARGAWGAEHGSRTSRGGPSALVGGGEPARADLAGTRFVRVLLLRRGSRAEGRAWSPADESRRARRAHPALCGSQHTWGGAERAADRGVAAAPAVAPALLRRRV